MEEQKYLIAIALAEQNNKRLMPLGGKTFSGFNSNNQLPNNEAEKIILELLIRLFQRSNDGSIKFSNYDRGLLLAEIGFNDMQNKIPLIKSNWINNGDTSTLINKLISICSNLWSVQYKKHEGIIFSDLRNKKLS